MVFGLFKTSNVVTRKERSNDKVASWLHGVIERKVAVMSKMVISQSLYPNTGLSLPRSLLGHPKVEIKQHHGALADGNPTKWKPPVTLSLCLGMWKSKFLPAHCVSCTVVQSSKSLLCLHQFSPRPKQNNTLVMLHFAVAIILHGPKAIFLSSSSIPFDKRKYAKAVYPHRTLDLSTKYC